MTFSLLRALPGLCFVAILLPAGVGLASQPLGQKPCVLMLHSHHEQCPWTLGLQRGMIETFDAVRPRLHLHVEHLDADWTPLSKTQELFEDLLRRKYAEEDIGVILVSGSQALRLARALGSELPTRPPVVFCALCPCGPDAAISDASVTGVQVRLPIRQSLELALGMHPGTRRVAVISDPPVDPVSPLEQFRQVWSGFASKGLIKQELVGLSNEDMVRALGKLEEDTIVLHLSWLRDESGRARGREDSIRLIDLHTSCPIYTVQRWKVGSGATGGVVVSASQIGARTARMALEILEGRQVSTLPIEQAPAPRTVFDYDKLTEVGMDVKALPAGAEILNQPASFFQEHRWWLLLGGGGVAALLIALALLLAHAVRRARVQRELQRRGDLLHSVLSHVPNYVYWKDREGVYRGCNENYARLLGLDGPEAIVGLTDHDLSWPVDQRKSSIRGDEQIVRSGQPALNAQEDLLLDRGPLRNVVRSRVPIIDKDGRVCGVLGMLLDITESKQLESRLRQSQKMEAIGQLAGGIAHDFNNLLAVIQGNAQLLQMFDSCKTGEDAGMVQEIVQASRRASSLTRQLLDFARKSDLRKEWTDVHTSVGEVVHMLTHSLDRKIEIRQELKARSPSLLVDPAQMQNAILNLCVNARDAMPSGGVLRICTEEVTLDRDFCARQREESIRPGRYLRITVSDTGVGISRDVQNRIFEPFFTTKEVGKGTGLGLAGVYGFVKSQQGLAKVESKVGQGTEMHLLLPLDASAQQSSTVEQQSEEQESGRLPQGRGRILIVDDEEMVRRFAAKALANLGYEVIEACDAATAQRAFHEAQEGFDLVLMDLILPKVGGEELFARLRKIRPDAQVLVMSGYSKKHVVDDLLQRGASGFLAKPFTLEALAESVSETLGGSRLRMQAS